MKPIKVSTKADVNLTDKGSTIILSNIYQIYNIPYLLK